MPVYSRGQALRNKALHGLFSGRNNAKLTHLISQKVAERFVAQLSPERRGWALVIYRILYWPIHFQKTIALLFGMLAILWLIYSWK